MKPPKPTKNPLPMTNPADPTIERLEVMLVQYESFFTRNTPRQAAQDYTAETVVRPHQLLPGDIVTWTGAFAVYEVLMQPELRQVPVDGYSVIDGYEIMNPWYHFQVKVLSSSRKHDLNTRLRASTEVSVLMQAPLPGGWEWIDTGEPRAYGLRTPEGANWGGASRSTLFQEAWESAKEDAAIEKAAQAGVNDFL